MSNTENSRMGDLRSLQTRYYEPKADITALELATLLPYLIKMDRNRGILFKDSTWGALPPNLQRHFTDKRP